MEKKRKLNILAAKILQKKTKDQSNKKNEKNKNISILILIFSHLSPICEII